MVARWRYSREPCGMFGPNDMNFGPILPKMYGMICEGQEIWQTNAGRAAYRSSGPHMFLFHTSLFTVFIIQIPYSWCGSGLILRKFFIGILNGRIWVLAHFWLCWLWNISWGHTWKLSVSQFTFLTRQTNGRMVSQLVSWHDQRVH